jgi:hypothetical protein
MERKRKPGQGERPQHEAEVAQGDVAVPRRVARQQVDDDPSHGFFVSVTTPFLPFEETCPIRNLDGSPIRYQSGGPIR